MGGTMVLDPELSVTYGQCLQISTFATSAPEGRAFSVAQDMMPNIAKAYTNKTFFEELAGMTLAPIVDGGFTDNTGIAHAVAAGATEVVVLLQWYDLVNLFAPGNTVYGDNLESSQIHFQVFAESASDVLEQFKGQDSSTGRGFDFLEVPPGNSTFLESFSFGAVHATTVESPWFGVRPGIPVTLHAIWPNTLLSWDGAENWYHYGSAIGEITSTMMYEPNRALTEKMLALVKG